MFTGLVEDIGTLHGRSSRGVDASLSITTRLSPLALGESIAVQGVCLTVEQVSPQGFLASASAETLARSTLGKLPVGAPLHLERAMPAQGRFGGHFVAGHVDQLGTLVAREQVGAALRMTFQVSQEIEGFLAAKGSVAIDGVSLTVNEVQPARFTLMVVPHTLKSTRLSSLQLGELVNIEVDMLARYVARWLQRGQNHATDELHGPAANRDDLLLDRLRKHGFTS